MPRPVVSFCHFIYSKQLLCSVFFLVVAVPPRRLARPFSRPPDPRRLAKQRWSSQLYKGQYRMDTRVERRGANADLRAESHAVQLDGAEVAQAQGEMHADRRTGRVELGRYRKPASHTNARYSKEAHARARRKFGSGIAEQKDRKLGVALATAQRGDGHNQPGGPRGKLCLRRTSVRLLSTRVEQEAG